MSKKSKEKRGCGVMFPSVALIAGLAACGWAFALGQLRGGDTVSTTLGMSFWLGWVCGIGLTVLGLVLIIIQRIIRAAGSAVDRATNEGRGGLDDLLPNIDFIDRFLR